MVYLYLIILAVFLAVFALSRKEDISAYTRGVEKKPSSIEQLFIKAAAWCVREKDAFAQRSGEGASKGRGAKYNARKAGGVGAKLKLLNPELSENAQVRNFQIKQYSTAFLVLFTGAALALCAASGARGGGVLKEGGYIQRNAYGKGDVELTLSAKTQDGESGEIFYTVEEEKFTGEEAAALYPEAAGLMRTLILGENESLEKVTKDLELITGIDGYPFAISWESDIYSLVHTDGSVQNEELEAPQAVMLTACFKYEDMEFEEVFPVRVCPAEYTAGELFLRRINEALEKENQASRTDGVMRLPETIGEENVIWEEVISDGSGSIFLLICAAAILVFVSQSRDIEQKLKKRNKELLLDYPEIVNKLTLYMGAGMTIRNAFFKMGEDYKKQKSPGEGSGKKSTKKRYVYEEILLLCHELKSGVSESAAYDHFGKRCGLQQYMKLSALLSQNIRKGSNNLLIMMRREASDAFEERKNTAKKLGEEAGTKLLAPMMMMLCIVMVIIMVPAFLSFSA